MAPAAFFLSSSILSRVASTLTPVGISRGRPKAAMQRLKRPTRAEVQKPIARAISASLTIPMATHSPCSRASGLSWTSASIPCPTVWPKFNTDRKSPSRSSRVTTLPFRAMELPMTSVSRSISPSTSFSACVSISSYNGKSKQIPILIDSDKPFLTSRLGKVLITSVSANTATGCQNAPMRFLPAGASMPVLPPMLESTIARTVVGTCTNGTPRMYVAAVNPERSPTTPPPRATTQVSRPHLALSI
mmetsp:Transcript_56720/g.130414  ORF Transcript_56720/g.130414 Transcript_56720/m.130414 type:complete len:246 (-) Transcript_56720:258-995(-)